MRFTTKKNYIGTIRKVWSDDKEVCYGLVGTVEDLLKEGILDYCDFSKDLWLFLPGTNIIYKPHFGTTREEALEMLPQH